ncbi:MAG: hypothetical protein AAGG07_14695 [Planctomycetota bacterium]
MASVIDYPAALARVRSKVTDPDILLAFRRMMRTGEMDPEFLRGAIAHDLSLNWVFGGWESPRRTSGSTAPEKRGRS